jgi:hypothetical protein
MSKTSYLKEASLNARQTLIVRVATLLLIAVSVQQGVENQDPFLTVALPIIFVAGLLLFEFRDKTAVRLARDEATLRKHSLIPLLCVAQFLMVGFTAVVAYQAKSAAEDAESTVSSTQENDLSGVESSLSSIDSKLDDLESGLGAKLDNLEIEVSTIRSRVTFR